MMLFLGSRDMNTGAEIESHQVGENPSAKEVNFPSECVHGISLKNLGCNTIPSKKYTWYMGVMGHIFWLDVFG